MMPLITRLQRHVAYATPLIFAAMSAATRHATIATRLDAVCCCSRFEITIATLSPCLLMLVYATHAALLIFSCRHVYRFYAIPLRATFFFFARMPPYDIAAFIAIRCHCLIEMFSCHAAITVAVTRRAVYAR